MTFLFIIPTAPGNRNKIRALHGSQIPATIRVEYIYPMLWKIKRLFLMLGDVIFLYVALAAALVARYGFADLSGRLSTHLYPFSALFLLWFFVFYLLDLYRPATFSTRKKMLRMLFQALATSGIVSIVLLYLFPDFFLLTPKTNLIVTGLIFFVLDGAFRLFFLQAFSIGALRVRFFGHSPLRPHIEEYLRSNPHIGYAIEEWIENPEEKDFAAMKTDARRENTLAVATREILEDSRFSKSIYPLMSHDVRIASLIDFYEEVFEKTPLEIVDPEWVIDHISTRKPFYELVKRALDFVVSLVLFFVLLPFGILVAFLIAISSRGPIFYTQPRMGRRNKQFTLYKFRTMVDGADKIGPAWTEKNDTRVTPLGRVFRYTHLDEIPQLVNILRGDISFTGPRPESAELAEKYSSLPYYDMRHSIAPGITGWAQINFKPSASVEEAYEKLRYDIFYIKNRSFFFDTLIMMRTVKHFFFSHE